MSSTSVELLYRFILATVMLVTQIGRPQKLPPIYVTNIILATVLVHFVKKQLDTFE